MTKRTIAVNANYRLIADTDNVMIERLVTVDPTKSPAFDATMHSPELRQEWRNIEKYFASIPKALAFLIEYDSRVGADATLGEVLGEIRAFRAHIDVLLGAEV